MKALFEDPIYKSKVDDICKSGLAPGGNVPEGNVVFRPTQINIVMIPPGQDLPMHQVSNSKLESNLVFNNKLIARNTSKKNSFSFSNFFFMFFFQ